MIWCQYCDATSLIKRFPTDQCNVGADQNSRTEMAAAVSWPYQLGKGSGTANISFPPYQLTFESDQTMLLTDTNLYSVPLVFQAGDLNCGSYQKQTNKKT